MRKLFYFLLPVLFFISAYWVSISSHDLIGTDEARYAEIPREMLLSGNWVVPRLDGVRYFEKPPMGYWLTAVSMKFLGETPMAIRLPTTLAVALTAFLIFIVVWQGSLRAWPKKTRKEKREERLVALECGEIDLLPSTPLVIASLATLIYLSSVGVFSVGNVALLDSIFTFFLSATIVSFFFATEIEPGKGGFRRAFFLLFSGIFCGCAFLTKGFLALALPILILVPWLLWNRRFVDLFKLSWFPLLVAFVLVLPWSLQIHWWDKDFWNYFFWYEHVNRFLTPTANQHEEPFWFFLLRAPLLSLPWLFLVPAMVAGFICRREEDEGSVPEKSYVEWDAKERLIRFTFLWFFLPFIFFSFSSGKLLTYMLPCLPPLSILMAFGLGRFFAQKDGRELFQIGVLVTAFAAFGGLLLLVYVQMFGVEGLRHFTGKPGGTPLYAESWKTGLVALSLGWMLLLLWFAWYAKGMGKVFAFALAPLLLFVSAGHVIPDHVVVRDMPGAFLEKYKDIVADDDIVIAGPSSVQQVSWFWRRTDVLALGWAGELSYGMERSDAQVNGLERIVSFDALKKIL